MRVLYLDVTTATEKMRGEDGEEHYVCRLNPTADARLEPLKVSDQGIRIFLSYRSNTRELVQRVYDRLVAMKPYVDPFIDVSMKKGDDWLQVLGNKITTSEICFLFSDGAAMGIGQEKEVEEIQARLFTQNGKKYPVVPVVLPPGPPLEVPFIRKQWVKIEELNDPQLREILISHFPTRCPSDWGRE